MLVNDLYKPKMHKLYAEMYTDVEATFCLNIRKTPFSLEQMSKEVNLCNCPLISPERHSPA